MRSLFVPVARLRNHNPLPVVYLLFTQQSIRNVCRLGGTARTNALQGTDASMGPGTHMAPKPSCSLCLRELQRWGSVALYMRHVSALLASVTMKSLLSMLCKTCEAFEI